MKRIIIFLSVAIFLSFGVNAQTLYTDTFSDANGNMPAVGANFDVPIYDTAIGTIFTLQVYFEYDTAVLSYTGYANAVPNTNISFPTPGVIFIEVGAFPNSTTFTDGLLVNLQFDFNGGYTNLNFGTVEHKVAGYNSKFMETTYTYWHFHDGDVTNGAVMGSYDNTIAGGDWFLPADWSLGVVPNMYHNVTVAAGAEITQINNEAHAKSVTVNPTAKLTLNSALTVHGDFTVESDATGDASFINNGTLTVNGITTVERYAVNGQWHGLSSPVMGATFATTYFGGNPEVWVKKYNEATNDYTYLVDTNALLGDMAGYFTWIQTSGTPQTYTFEGSLYPSTVGPVNIANTNTGHGFVGNPFTSAIDWDATTGWTKTNLYNAIYVYNGSTSNWSSYVAGTPINGGSQYISMGQGFFVQVASGSSSGSLQMTNEVCVHNAVGFMKDEIEQSIVRLQVEDAGKVDETVIRFAEEATTDFDGNLDAAKFFSFSAEQPQIYSTANNFMSINSIPYSIKSVDLDVRGKDGNTMTISATESEGFDFLNLKDNNTGVTTDLKTGDYTFTYNSDVTDRFELFFGFTGIDTPTIDNSKIYSVDNTVKVILESGVNADITVYNLLGQVVAGRAASGTVTTIAVEKTGYYLVKVNDGATVTTKKVFIR